GLSSSTAAAPAVSMAVSMRRVGDVTSAEQAGDLDYKLWISPSEILRVNLVAWDDRTLTSWHTSLLPKSGN
ncbi:MAG: hypothetical protein Q9206_007127, partial [Seirophora lacunosa]